MVKSDRQLRWAGGTLAGAFHRIVRSPYGTLLLGLLTLLVIGVTFLTDYGASIDEWHNAFYGRLFLQQYETGSLLRSPGIDYFNGPFYFMLFTITSWLFRLLNPAWLPTDGLHLTNYLTFLVGVFIFYRLSLRMLPRNAALFATALFTTQPVVFGHAFINQKDTPLMVFFLAAVESGLTAVESRLSPIQAPTGVGEGRPKRRAAEEWRQLPAGIRIAVVTGALAGVILLMDLWWIGSLRLVARTLLTQIYAGQAPAFLLALFGRIAEDAHKTPLSAYVAKLNTFLSWARWAVTPAILAGMLILARLHFPDTFASSAGTWFRRWGAVLLAGTILGLATSIRVLAPFAGLLVSGYWVIRAGRRSWPGLLVYGAAAIVTTYLTWPVLWGNPLMALSERATELEQFSRYEVLFRGGRIEASNLPWEFIPTLFAIQLTLPASLLFLLGTPFSVILSRRDRERRLLVGLSWLWLLLPVIAVMVGLVPIYHNFRHVLFTLPPAFLIAGFGAWALAAALRTPLLRVVLAGAALSPGIAGIVTLHPYQYIYYNELVGGVRGAEGRFDLDYWCTAFRDAMSVVNEVARPGARVAIARGLLSASPFAREDLELTQGGTEPGDPDFAMACRRDVYRASFFPEMERVYEVRADGALLAVVKQGRGP